MEKSFEKSNLKLDDFYKSPEWNELEKAVHPLTLDGIMHQGEDIHSLYQISVSAFSELLPDRRDVPDMSDEEWEEYEEAAYGDWSNRFPKIMEKFYARKKDEFYSGL